MPEDNTLKIRLSLKGRPLKSYRFNQDLVTVGRDPGADVFLDNPGISREHACFERLPNGHFGVRDSGSANGVFLNEERVQAAMVYNNDVVRIGKFSLWIAVERDPRGVEPRQEPRVARDSSQQTVMHSTEELERLMSITRETDAAPPPPATEYPTPGQRASGDWAASPQQRIRWLIGIGSLLILATSVGAGLTWFFLR